VHDPSIPRLVQTDADVGTDAEVVEISHGHGRDRAFDDLYRREHLAMRRLGYLLTGSQDAAAEVTHDAFVRTYQHWDRLDRPGAYLRRAVVNGCNDHHRRRIRRATTSVAEVADRVDPRTEGAAAAEEQLADAIATLRPKRRAAIVLRYYLDLPQAEIAATLGVRQGTVKSLLHRGLADLRAALADDLDADSETSARLRSTGATQTTAPRPLPTHAPEETR